MAEHVVDDLVGVRDQAAVLGRGVPALAQGFGDQGVVLLQLDEVLHVRRQCVLDRRLHLAGEVAVAAKGVIHQILHQLGDGGVDQFGRLVAGAEQGDTLIQQALQGGGFGAHGACASIGGWYGISAGCRGSAFPARRRPRTAAARPGRATGA
ncbi:hypothetical protein D3C85_1428150 [compost metagenome]